MGAMTDFDISDGVLKTYYGKEKIVIIPDGVVEIGEAAFKCNKTMKELIMPNSVIKIECCAFGFCNKLEKITFSSALESIEEAAFSDCEKIVSISFPESLKKIGISAFSGCKSIESIIVPSSVKEVGIDAFYGCKKLCKLIMPEATKIGIDAFSDCKKLIDENDFIIINGTAYGYYGKSEKLVIPEGVKIIFKEMLGKMHLHLNRRGKNIKTISFPNSLEIIEAGAFKSCGQLTEIIVPESVKIIEDDAFAECKKVKKVCVPKSVKLGISSFSNCPSLKDENGFVIVNSVLYNYYGSFDTVEVPNGIETIGPGAFANTIVRSIKLPQSIKVIGDSAFYECKQLTSIEMNEGIESIGESAFCACFSLKTISIPSSVKVIGKRAFEKCYKLEKVMLPDGIVKMEQWLFWMCSSLKEVNIPRALKKLDSRVFDDCKQLVEITLPDSLEYLGEGAFWGCTSLKKINIPGQLETIPEKFMFGCEKIKKIVISEGIKKIGSFAFCRCESLTEVNLPSTLEVISSSAFSGCEKLKEIRIPRGVSEIQTCTFDGCASLASIQVEDGNSTYSIVDGLLCSKDGKEIIVCPAGLKLEEYTIKDGVTTIHEHAFMSCNRLKKVVIPSSVIRIGDVAFPQSWGGKNSKLTDIQVDPEIKLSYVGESIFGFPRGDAPLVYPLLPPTVVKEQTTQVRLGLGFCSSTSSYTGKYLDLYKKYAVSHQKTLIKKARDLDVKEVLNYYLETDETNSVTGKVEKVDYKKLSEMAKVELLERVIVEGDLNALKEVITECGKFEFLARALGIACVYGGLDKVELLVDSGAKFIFKYDRSLDRKYGRSYVSTYYLMVADAGSDVFASDLNAKKQELRFGFKLPKIEKKQLNADERGAVAEFLCDNAEKIGFKTGEVLFYAIMWGCKPVAEALIKKGCELTKYGIEALSDTSYSEKRNEILCTLPILKPDICAYAISKYVDLLENKGLKFIVTQKMFEEKNTSFISDEVIGVIIDRADTSRLTKSKILELVVKDNKIAAIEKLAEAGWFKTPAQRDKLIKYATDNKCKEALAWLLDYKNRTADFKKEAAKAEAKMMKELTKKLTKKPKSAPETKKTWLTKKAEDGTLILTNYRGESTEIVVPAIIGKTPVSIIGKEAVKAYGTWPPARVENNDVREAITSVVISEGIKEISTDAFSGLEKLVKVDIPDSVITIGDNAFSYCEKLSKVEIPDSVITIGDDAFSYCKKLTFDGLRIPTNVKFGGRAFRGCKGLLDETGCVVINSILVAVDEHAKEIIVPDGVVEIAPYVFKHCSVEKVVLPGTVKNIGEEAFYCCYHLKSVNIPNGIKIIRENTFGFCDFKDLVIPDSVTTIRENAFFCCNHLKSIKIPASVTSIDEAAFESYLEDLTVYTPAGSRAEEYFKNNTEYIIKEYNIKIVTE